MPTANVSTLLDYNVRRFPEREAIVFGDRRSSYRQLDQSVDRAAAALRAAGVRDGDRVALLALNSDRYLIAVLAVAKLGGVFVTLNVRLAAPELGRQLGSVSPVVLLTDAEYEELAADSIAQSRAGRPALLRLEPDAVGAGSLAELEAAAPPERLPHAPKRPEDPQRVMFTSGTTSHPKAAVLTHGNVIFNCYTIRTELGLAGQDRVVIAAPLFHTSGLDVPGLATLYVGGTAIVLDRHRAPLMIDAAERERATGMLLVAPVIHDVLASDLSRRDLSALRWVISGALTPGTLRALLETFPGLRVVNGYGMTETLSGMVYNGPEGVAARPQSMGGAVRVMDVRIVDEGDREVPPGTDGDVIARGLKASPGYLADDGQLVPHCDGWLRTGDVARFDETGSLYFVGRRKAMIKPGGENVALEEIERVLQDHPAVAAVCAIGVPDERWGEVAKAFVELEPDGTASADDLEQHCRRHLGGFKVPRHWELLTTPLPRLASGKVARTQIEQLEVEKEGRFAASVGGSNNEG